MHKTFQELSALAATGQITREEREQLDRHTAECAECRAFLSDLTLLKARVAPVVAASCAQSFEPPAGIRERFLQRAAAAGLNLEAGPVMAVPPAADPVPIPWPREAKPRARGFGSMVLRFALPAAVCLFCGFFGYYVAQQRLTEVPPPNVTAHAIRIPWQIPEPPLVRTPSLESGAMADKIAQLEQARQDSQHRIDALSADLQRAQSDAARLSRELSAASDQASAGGRFEQQFKSEAQKVQNAEDRIRQLNADLATERDRRRRLEIAALQPQTSNAQADARISELEGELTRERDTRADKSEFTQLVAARNLHIVDVYDTASNGQRQRPFGRVFYVEGKSLVFYAYDLNNQQKAAAQVAFHVWGEKAAVKSTTYNLGILRGDGAGQSRWVLTFDDPKVLNNINAVYVTAEAVSGDREPRGRKILYAFLGSPNHP
jgi:hypothetical protein